MRIKIERKVNLADLPVFASRKRLNFQDSHLSQIPCAFSIGALGTRKTLKFEEYKLTITEY